MKKEIKRIAVFTSGGDAPGMNAAIRAVVRNATFKDLHVYGVTRGYEGLINGDMKRLETSDVGNIIHRGGTILKTARSQRFMTPEGRQLAFEALEANEIDDVIPERLLAPELEPAESRGTQIPPQARFRFGRGATHPPGEREQLVRH